MKGKIMRHPILIVRSAFDQMLATVKSSPVEIGSILLGVIAEHIVVMAVGKPGENSIQEAVRFVHDPAEDQKCLQEQRQKHGQKIAILGGFHKHPSGMHWFSSQDNQQAQEIFMQNGDGKPVLIGIWAEAVRGPEPHLFLYILESENGRLTPVGYDIVTPSDSRVAGALKDAPVFPEQSINGFWEDTQFQFYHNSVGRERIRNELATLRKQGWKVQTIRKAKTKKLILSLHRDTRQFLVMLPPEFPLNPPRIYDLAGFEVLGLHALMQWNSDRCIAAIIEQYGQIFISPLCNPLQQENLLWHTKNQTGTSRLLSKVKSVFTLARK
ncbi:hypothetical protein Pan241w_26440 [Gimesia alba]|uniref:JAB domain-containing protein n=1 Tax=Gimesia alba TaxID=2527973 RepID=A0A517RFA5_9PLAN|nr:hypothetical protein [Gimesia alba]QDT42559.1 hypothetical protein Pan241w_26440 [Gimesia alba]